MGLSAIWKKIALQYKQFRPVVSAIFKKIALKNMWLLINHTPAR